MPSSLVRTFAEADEYAAAMRQGTVELTVMQRGAFAAKLCRIDFKRLWMQRFSVNLGWTSHIDYWGGYATIAFQTRPGPNMMRNGRECTYTSIVRLSADQSYYLSSPGSASYGTISLPLDELASLGPMVGARAPISRKDYAMHTPSPAALAKVRRLHEAAGHLAEDAPTVLAHPEAARGLEQALIEAMTASFGDAEVDEDRAALRQHATIMRRFHTAIEQRLDQPLYLPELCKEIGASERTLRACCQEHLGMGPKHFLLLRRMHMVRRALRASTPADTSVTEIATRYGFWQFGRLAAEYKALFGETPSRTLASPVPH
jgi:AraC-like DNA-binding protein